ncbi:MAG: hypothetical protein K9K35_11880 [Rhodoferax sp.]|nr:hypothetical protein [Rhodoferax sp.]
MTVETEMMNEENGRLRRHIKTLEAELKKLEAPAWLLKSTQDLCLSLAKRVYPEVTGFQVLDDLAGVISQIDNITCGMERKRDQAAQAQDKDALFFERAEKLAQTQVADPVRFTLDQLTAAIAIARAAALDEAALVAGGLYQHYRDLYKGRTEPINKDHRYNPHTDGVADGAGMAEDAIRALKGST